MNNFFKSWSIDLIEQTKHSIENYFVAPDGFLHMKNLNGNFGKISFENLIANRLLIEDKLSDTKNAYDTLDELIADGWVID